ncbi:MAG: hypothetical protein M0Z72_07515, partial [Deltaproteobacteria bacterium]|nr:hypothetical protein [Deltaproteobacteria bacterium]
PQDFIIYNSNAGLIGQIKDNKLRKNIVRFYTLGKGFSNAVLYTNKIILIFQDYLSRHPEYTEPNSDPLIHKVIKTYQDYLNGFMRELKSQYNELECSSKILKELIEELKETDLFTSADIKAGGFYKRPPPYSHSRLRLTMPSGVFVCSFKIKD